MKLSTARILMYEVCRLSDGKLTWPTEYSVGELMNFVKLAPKLTGVGMVEIEEAFSLLSKRNDEKQGMVVKYNLEPEIDVVKRWINYSHGRKVVGYLKYDCSLSEMWEEWLINHNLANPYWKSHDDYYLINIYRESDDSFIEKLPIEEFERKYGIKHRYVHQYMTRYQDLKPRSVIQGTNGERVWMQRECDRRAREKELYC